MNTTELLETLSQINPETSPGEIFALGHKLAGGKLRLASSFGIEDIVLIDLLQDHLDTFSIFAIDTGRLNEETYEIADRIADRYGIHIDWFFPRLEAVEQLASKKGLFSFRESIANRRECCHIRKVEPLQRALAGYSGWITGLRREQATSRDKIQPIERDRVNGGLIKINPLVFWRTPDIWTYAEKHRLPINPLHRRGYPSIGCAPCTRPVQPEEHARAGRWWWEDPDQKECGLHRR